MLSLLLTHFLSHLAKMLLHDSVTCQFVFVVNSLSESHNISRVHNTFILWITHFSNSFEFCVESLWIWIGHVEGLGLWLGLAISFGSRCEARRRLHGEISLANWVDLEAAVGWNSAISWVCFSVFINLFQHGTLAGVRLPAQLSIPARQSANLKSNPNSLSTFKLMNQLR